LSDPQRLKVELETYEREKPRLVAEHAGKYALIHGSDVSGVWDTYENALQAGYSQSGLDPFLVKQIQDADRVYFFTWDIALCPS
jgi:hypothetical protein